MKRRADLEAVARLLAVVGWLDALPWDGVACRLLDASVPTLAQRDFPSRETMCDLARWPEDGDAPLAEAVIALIDGELAAMVESDLALLR